MALYNSLLKNTMNKNVSHLLMSVLALRAISLNPWTEALAKRPVQLQSFGPLHLPAPALIPGTLPEMNSAGFWIGTHPCPDKIILDAKGIQLLNMAIRTELKCSYDLSSY